MEQPKLIGFDSQIALGKSDYFQRTPSIEIREGKIKFLPGQGTKDEFEPTTADFTPGSRIEYRVERGDLYFSGDHGLALERALWVIQPDGSKTLLASGFVLYINLTVAARNLEKRGIPFRAVSFYERKEGGQAENEIPISPSRVRFPISLLLALSNLWLGIIAGIFVHRTAYVVVIGAVGCLVLIIARVRLAPSKRSALLQVLSTLPTYAGGYALMVFLVRSASRR